ncbi:MAG: hypothetical protein AAFN18_21325 [Cyanobacteria bacterium J06554_6]
MKKFLTIGAIAGLLTSLTAPAQAIPGESVDEVKAWMQGHPTLRATENERLQVQRTETPARRYIFRATIFPIGGTDGNSDTPAILNRGLDRSQIRVETFMLVDTVDGVDYEDLEEALRVIYGPDLYADYRRSTSTRLYPVSSPARLLRPNRSDARGQVREGAAYGYWLELIPNPDGTVHTGSISVLLPEDIDQLQSHLEQTGR